MSYFPIDDVRGRQLVKEKAPMVLDSKVQSLTPFELDGLYPELKITKVILKTVSGQWLYQVHSQNSDVKLVDPYQGKEIKIDKAWAEKVTLRDLPSK